MIGRCQGRHVLVTGGTSGIGYAIAKRFAQETASSVVVVSRSEDRARKAAERIKDEIGRSDVSVEGVELDVTEYAKLKDKKYEKIKSRINTLINCAGITQSSLAIRSTSGIAEQIIQQNLLSTMGMSSIFLDLMRRRYISSKPSSDPSTTTTTAPISPVLINISSLLALKDGYGTSAYAASKAGIIAFTRALCLEGAEIFSRLPSNSSFSSTTTSTSTSSTTSSTNNNPSIESRITFRANTIVPGYIATPMLSSFSSQHTKSLEAKIPLHRLGRADEVADAAVFLVLNEYANNCVLNLDGGLSAT